MAEIAFADRIEKATERATRSVAATLTPHWHTRFVALQAALGLSISDTVREAVKALWDREQSPLDNPVVTPLERRAIAAFLGHTGEATRDEMRAYLKLHGSRGLAIETDRWLARGQSLPLVEAQS